MLYNIRDTPKGRMSPNKQWVLKLLSSFMTLSTEWVRGPVEALAHGGKGTAFNGWWCQDSCHKEVGFFSSDVGARGRVAQLIPSRVRGFNEICWFAGLT